MERKRSGGGTKRKRADSAQGGGSASSKKSKRRIKPFSFALIPGEPEAALRARLLAAPAGALKAVSQRYRISSKNREVLAHNLANTIVRERFTQDAVFAYPPPAAAAAPAVPLVCHIARLSSAVLVHVSQFLVLHEVAALACTNRTNRTVATLRIDDTSAGSDGSASSDGEVKSSVSPCLLRRKHFAFYNHCWQERYFAACVSEETVRRLLSCTSELQSLELNMTTATEVFVLFEAALASSERTLQRVSIGSPGKASGDKLLAAIFRCPNLRSLTWWHSGLRIECKSLALRPSLQELHCDVATAVRIAPAAPNVRTLSLLNLNRYGFWRPDDLVGRFPLLEELIGPVFESDVQHLVRFPALRRACVDLIRPPEPKHFERLRGEAAAASRIKLTGQASAAWLAELRSRFPLADLSEVKQCY